MPSSSEPARRKGRMPAFVAAVAALGLAAGCARRPDPGTAVKGFEASLVFGVKPVEEPSQPANADFAGLSATNSVRDNGLPSALVDEPSPFVSNKPRPPLAKPAPCPPASASAAPAEPAGTTVPSDRLPVGGVYRWRKAGTVTLTSLPIPLQVGGFEQRLVRNVGRPPSATGAPSTTTFTYETVQPASVTGGGGLVATTWQVNTNPTTFFVTPPTANVPVTAGDPERGIVIKRIQNLDSSGRPAGPAFAPLTGLLLLPIPARQSESFTSVAVDPATQQTGQFAGQVVDKQLVDACGDLLDAWHVHGTLSFSSGLTRTVDYSFSLPLGGLLVEEKFSETTADATGSLDYTIGQLKPASPS